MIVKRLFDPKLAQVSYLIACGQKGVAVVVDPSRDAAMYIATAEAEGVRITDVTETHIHADFLSGARDLARLTGATLHLSDEGGDGWRYAYAKADGAHLLTDGGTFMVGNVRVQAVHTPGHTPEHLSFLITDTAAADEPIGIVTGDFVFVGDVGRPDLLERAAQVTGTMEASARTLFRSLQRFRAYPDWLQIWPGHGAGSACGKGLSSVPHSTVGYEKRFNWAFAVDDEKVFVRSVLEGQPEPPKYFATMKRLNRDGPPAYDPGRQPNRLTLDDLSAPVKAGTMVVDTRTADVYATGHVPGTINIPRSRSFSTYAGWFLPYDRDVVLIVEDSADAIETVRDLAMIGVDRVVGFVDAALMVIWRAAGRALAQISHVDARQAQAMVARGAAMLDVRGRSEWEAWRIAGVPNIPYGTISDRMADLPDGRPLILQCQSGARSAIAASVLAAAGVTDVVQLTGGIEAWERAGLPVEQPGAVSTGA